MRRDICTFNSNTLSKRIETVACVIMRYIKARHYSYYNKMLQTGAILDCNVVTSWVIDIL